VLRPVAQSAQYKLFRGQFPPRD